MVLEFEKDKVYVKFTTEKDVKATHYAIKIFAANRSSYGSEKHIFTSKTYPLNKDGENEYWVVIDYMFYNTVAKKVAVSGKPLPNIINFFFKVVIDEEENDVLGFYSVHFVRYMPKILNILGFSNGEKLQRIWFTKGNNEDLNGVNPKLEAVDWDWVMSESIAAKQDYKNFYLKTWSHLNDNYFITTNKIRNALKNEINKMIDNGIVSLPTKNSGNQSFGVTDSEIIPYEGEKIPKFEEHYFNSTPFDAKLLSFDLNQHYLRDGLDDFVAAIGSFNFHVLALGELEYKEGVFSDKVRIKVKKLGFYIKDSFDFIREPEPLGFWKIVDEKTIKVELDPPNKEGYYEVENKLYRDYRKAHKEGYNYRLYSNIHYENVNLTVTLKKI